MLQMQNPLQASLAGFLFPSSSLSKLGFLPKTKIPTVLARNLRLIVTWLGLTLVWRFCANYGIDFSPQFYFIKKS